MNAPWWLDTREALGPCRLWSHLLLDLGECNPETLWDLEKVKQSLHDAVRVAWLNIIWEISHKFNGEGWVTCVFALEESHISIHTWPEYAAATVDIFVCWDVQFHEAMWVLESALGAKKIVNVQNVWRWLSNWWIQVPGDIDPVAIDWEKWFNDSKAWWLEAQMDIHNCNSDLIKDSEKVKEYVITLCDDIIDMTRYGEAQTPNFWENPEVAWLSLNQFIETSNVTGHFANKYNAVLMNVFSCKFFDPIAAGNFTRDFFQWDAMNISVTKRYAQQ
jgi:S-adenosylmethionine decarboxylase